MPNWQRKESFYIHSFVGVHLQEFDAILSEAAKEEVHHFIETSAASSRGHVHSIEPVRVSSIPDRTVSGYESFLIVFEFEATFCLPGEAPVGEQEIDVAIEQAVEKYRQIKKERANATLVM